MAAVDTISKRWHPLPLWQVIYEQLGGPAPEGIIPGQIHGADAGPIERSVWVRAQSGEHAAWKAANLVSPYGWELVEVIRVR